ncbi:hypothetical protein E3U55_11305 [Filobacillus milosensis]|uniref:Polysaccharide chain length determinant N-terminal domain-containing protein n=1 Tax=Filobacillus milosensis TaxID=94137 RepID=A0A4Y8IFT5_9BACI|nr:Wzz/FepE/Etk N-terminal domain-containing protein [Filobacillus milosensis]TFB19291.1 hypothetical protein E3U55_11305 [Filobacillus milosensis]
MNDHMEEEISLREIIETLWEGKWIIAGVTAIIVALAAIYSFVIATPTYESKATVVINKTDLPTGSLTEYTDNATSRDVVVQVMQSPEVMQRTKKNLNLEEKTVASLQNNINVSVPKENETLIHISQEGADRELISTIIKEVIANTESVIKEDLKDYFTSYEKLYQEKMQEEEEALTQYLEEYNALEEANGLPLLVLFQQNASGTQYVLEANEELLQELRDLEKITQVEYEQINAKIDHANENYKNYSIKYEDAKTANTLNIVEERIGTLSSAYAGIDPVSPNKLLNIAIGFVLGLMVSVFIVFIRAYWKNSSVE